MARALVVAALAVVGCGTLGSTDDPRGPALGITPWRDDAPLTVCRGEFALAPPTSQPGGLCVRATAAAIECQTDRDCASRELCHCGRCTVAYCAVASDCDPPRSCNFAQHRCDLSCGSDRDCGAGERCLGGVCRGRCLDSTDCQFGEVCEGSFCIGDDCSQDSECLIGERCAIQRVPVHQLEPAAIASGGQTVLYLDLAEPLTPDDRSIWRALSRDGVHFALDPPVPVISGGRAPSAVVAGEATVVYFEDASGIVAAASLDGATFGSRTTVVAGDVHEPAAVALSTGSLALYYRRGDAIGLAIGPVGGPVGDLGIVLDAQTVAVGDGVPGTAFWTPVIRLASPHAIVAGDPDEPALYLYFSALGVESAPATMNGQPIPIDPNWSIGFAAAPLADPAALAAWPFGPVVARVDAFVTHLDELTPNVVADPRGGYRMFFIDGRAGAIGKLTALAQ